MKRYFLLIMTMGLALPAFGQTPVPPAEPPSPTRTMPQRSQRVPAPEASFSERLSEIVQKASEPAAPSPELPRFNLDFPGGTPKELVKAIEKASGKPLNAVIREEDAGMRLAAMSVKNVNVAQLFNALIQVSTEEQAIPTGITTFGDGRRGGMGSYQIRSTSYGFRTEGTPSESSIWYFFHIRPARVPEPEQPLSYRFYQLGPYLDANYKVEDITTAVETAWKMMGDKNPPKLSYHKDTKLLIAVGENDSLEMISQVLRQLTPVGAQSTPPAKTPPKP